MNINIKATNTTLTPSIKNHIDEKLSHLAKFIRPEDKIHVELEVGKKHKSGFVHRAEITIYPHNHFAEARGIDFYAALDLLIPKIKEQLVKEKEKKITLKRRLRVI